MEFKEGNIDKREIIKNMLKENTMGLTPEELKAQEDVLIEIFEEGILPYQALGFSDEFLDYVYKYAYALYQQNKIEEASQLYRWLKTMIPVEEKYTIALTHCFIQQKKWEAAISYLFELAYTNLENPYPFEKMYECFLELKDLKKALVSICKAIERAGNKKEFAAKKEQWIVIYNSLLKQLDIDPAIVEQVRAQRATEGKSVIG